MLIVSWPSPSTGFTLQENTNGISTTNWTDVTEPVHDTGTAKYIMASPLTGNRFYRLRSP
jgi:hypothetical protein